MTSTQHRRNRELSISFSLRESFQKMRISRSVVCLEAAICLCCYRTSCQESDPCDLLRTGMSKNAWRAPIPFKQKSLNLINHSQEIIGPWIQIAKYLVQLSANEPIKAGEPRLNHGDNETLLVCYITSSIVSLNRVDVEASTCFIARMLAHIKIFVCDH